MHRRKSARRPSKRSSRGTLCGHWRRAGRLATQSANADVTACSALLVCGADGYYSTKQAFGSSLTKVEGRLASMWGYVSPAGVKRPAERPQLRRESQSNTPARSAANMCTARHLWNVVGSPLLRSDIRVHGLLRR